MYPVYPHASQLSFPTAHPARAVLPYDPAPQAPSAARTSPAVWVLVAMGLMAALGGLFATCGVLVAAVAFAPDHGANHVAPTTQVTRDQQM